MLYLSKFMVAFNLEINQPVNQSIKNIYHCKINQRCVITFYINLDPLKYSYIIMLSVTLAMSESCSQMLNNLCINFFS